MRIAEKLQFVRRQQNPNAFWFSAGNKERGLARPDTLGVYFDTASIKQFYEQKSTQLEQLKSLQESGQLDIQVSDYLLPFEQVLAHEAYHIYQFLNCTIMSDHASTLRRKAHVEMKILNEVITQNEKLASKKEILEYEFSDKDADQYIDRVCTDAYNMAAKIDQRLTENHLSLREIIEACAVSFQLISQNDYLNEKIPITNTTYTIAWDRFVQKLNLDIKNQTAVLVARMTFLFMGDVYLKFAHNDFRDTADFDEALGLVVPLVDSFSEYIEEFEGNAKHRDELLMDSLTHIEKDQSAVDAIIEYCGELPFDGQMRLYVNIRLYSDVFKRVALAGATSRNRPNNNKNKAVNRELKKLFPYWESDFVIPCILANFEQCSKFATIWMRIHDVKFMDEIEQQQFSLEEDNFVLNFADKFSRLLLDPNSGTQCCAKHGFEDIIQKLMQCTEPDSLNQICVKNFGKSLGEIIQL